MTRPTEIRIDRLVLPYSERHRADAFRTALERSLGAEFSGNGAGSSGDPRADRAARAVAERARRDGT